MVGGNSEEADRGAARLQALLDTSFSNEAVSRGMSVEDAQDKKVEIYERLAGLGGDAIGMVPKVGTALSYGVDYASSQIIDDIFEDYVVTSSRGSEYTDKASVDNYTRTAVLEHVVASSEGSLPSFNGTSEETSEQFVEELVDKRVLVENSDGSYSVNRDSDSWSVGIGDDGVSQALGLILDSAEVDWIEGHPVTGEGSERNGQPAADFSDEYVESYGDAYGDVHDQLGFNRSNIQDLYSRC